MPTAYPHAIRVALVQTDPLRALGFHTVLASEPEFLVQQSTIENVLSGRYQDVVLLAADGQKLHSAMSALRAVRPNVRVIVTGKGNREEDVLRALSAGAKGYVAEDATPAEVKQAIRAVNDGSVWAPGRVLSTFIERATLAPRTYSGSDEVRISQRERQVLKLLVAGRSNREIGDALGIEERTVKAHVAQLLRKVGVQNRIALSVHAVTHALLSVRQ